jgi:hypothetical protein
MFQYFSFSIYNNMSLAIDEVIPRYVEENPLNYTKAQLAARKKALLDMKRDYPRLPESWLEMAYDFHANTPSKEIEDIINSGKWDVPGKFSKSSGGVLVCGEILDPMDTSGN